jgi:hypothetical protein
MRLFTGDFSTGDFSQWPVVNNKLSPGPSSGYVPQYPATVISEDKDCGYIARFEVREGDVPFGSGERSEVSDDGSAGTAVMDGETAWYAFSIKFDETFPDDQWSVGWGIVIQWHDLATDFSPVLSFGWKTPNPGDPNADGKWFLVQNQQDASGTQLGGDNPQMLLELPLNQGEWHDFKMQIKMSGSTSSDGGDPDSGLVRVWRNGVAQTLLGGSTTFIGQTIVPGVAGVKNQLGLYRQLDTAPTGIVYHTGFRVADSEDSL